MPITELPEGITPVTSPLPGWRVTTPAAEALVTRQGAQLVHWQPAGHRPVLYLSAESQWRENAPIRGGIPICFPWFGGGRGLASPVSPSDGPLDPSHGWARVTDWDLVGATVEDDGTAELVFELSGAAFTGQPHQEHFPADASVRYTMRIGAQLSLELAVIAGDTLVDVETALHTYFSVADAHRTTITGLEGADYWDKVDSRVQTQRDAVTLDSETDRVYTSGGPVRIDDGERTIEVTTTGASSTVVWNPWQTKARAMADFGDDDYLRMVCVESGNVLQHAIVVPPGEQHEMSVTYKVR